MSGYNKKTGVFELTHTKAWKWFAFRNNKLPDGFSYQKTYGSMYFFAALLRYLGLDVLKIRRHYLDVKATPEQLWEALSGCESNPTRAVYYYEDDDDVLDGAA